jgi:hypothetical protein
MGTRKKINTILGIGGNVAIYKNSVQIESTGHLTLFLKHTGGFEHENISCPVKAFKGEHIHAKKHSWMFLC